MTFPLSFVASVRSVALGMVAMLIVAATASADITSLSGQIQSIAPPFSVQQGAAEDNTLGGVFAERQSITLVTPLALTISTSGVFNETADLTPGSVPVGTVVNSYFVHVDSDTTFAQFAGSLTFDETILGIIALQSELQASHAPLGLASVVYPATGSADAAQGPLDFAVPDNDELQINMAAGTVNFRLGWTNSNMPPYEQFRIITAGTAVPEPTSACLSIVAMVSLIGLRTLRSTRNKSLKN